MKLNGVQEVAGSRLMWLQDANNAKTIGLDFDTDSDGEITNGAINSLCGETNRCRKSIV